MTLPPDMSVIVRGVICSASIVDGADRTDCVGSGYDGIDTASHSSSWAKNCLKRERRSSVARALASQARILFSRTPIIWVNCPYIFVKDGFGRADSSYGSRNHDMIAVGLGIKYLRVPPGVPRRLLGPKCGLRAIGHC